MENRNEKLLSIIVPCYNSEAFLKKMIKSLLEIPGDGIEFIFTDDGSTDGTPVILRKITDSRVKILSQENGGPGKARNTGLNLASGKYVMFADNDDIMDTDSMKKLLPILAEQENVEEICLRLTREQENLGDGLADFLKSRNADERNSSTVLHALMAQGEKETHYFDQNNYAIYGPVAKFYRRDIIEKHNIRFRENLRWGEDIAFNMEYLGRIRSVTFWPVTIYYYRDNDASLIGKKFVGKSSHVKKFIYAASEILDLKNDETLHFFEALCAKQYIYALQNDFLCRENPESYMERRKKAVKFLHENAFFERGIRQVRLKLLLPANALCVILVRLGFFFALQCIIRLYERI